MTECQRHPKRFQCLMTCNKLFCFFVLDKLSVIIEFLYVKYCDGLQSASVNKLSHPSSHCSASSG